LYARIVALNLKPNQLTNFQQVLDKQVMPILRKQTGFKDVITLANSNGNEVRSISLWEKKENAEAYNSSGYPEVLKLLATVIDGTPRIHTYDVLASTLHQVAAFATV